MTTDEALAHAAKELPEGWSVEITAMSGYGVDTDLVEGERIEWSLMRDITNPRYIQCPWCGGFKPHHDPHCRLAAAIKAAKGVG